MDEVSAGDRDKAEVKANRSLMRLLRRMGDIECGPLQAASCASVRIG